MKTSIQKSENAIEINSTIKCPYTQVDLFQTDIKGELVKELVDYIHAPTINQYINKSIVDLFGLEKLDKKETLYWFTVKGCTFEEAFKKTARDYQVALITEKWVRAVKIRDNYLMKMINISRELTLAENDLDEIFSEFEQLGSVPPTNAYTFSR